MLGQSVGEAISKIERAASSALAKPIIRVDRQAGMRLLNHLRRDGVSFDHFVEERSRARVYTSKASFQHYVRLYVTNRRHKAMTTSRFHRGLHCPRFRAI